MPMLTLPTRYEDDAIIAQRAYSWYFPQETEPVRTNFEFSGATILGVATSAQLEMFQERTNDEYFTFKSLMDKWRIERGSTSSTTEMVLCPAYQSIIGMGPIAIPLILAELVSEGNNPDHWFWALQVLTRANPVPDEDEGNLRKMTRAWLGWAAAHGYVW